MRIHRDTLRSFQQNAAGSGGASHPDARLQRLRRWVTRSDNENEVFCNVERWLRRECYDRASYLADTATKRPRRH